MVEDVARRLRRLEDRAAIHDLVARYALAVDDHDYAALQGMYAADAVFRHAGAVLRGREAIVAFLQERAHLNGKTVHTPHTVVIDWVDDDTARGTVTGHAEIERGGEFLVAAFRYDDTYVRGEGAWKFQERTTKFRYVAPVDALKELFRSPLTVRWPGTDPVPGEW
ncbi:nuclear transport factor 2 family protein [Thermobifida fusca]|uniref:nuclear transport factor 2 family protein n=1 Tax=Thermobifida fusca TaxID=2021 RepID=UPI00156B9A0D|nr:nuclear transport factor 2 family protein [Thermobifida fusca]